MVVFIDEIGDDGLRLEKELTTEFLSHVLSEEDPATGFRPSGNAELSVYFKKLRGKIFLEGKTTLPLRVACKRCLSEIRFSLPISFQLFLVAANASKQVNLEEKKDSKGPGGEDVHEAGSVAAFDADSVDEEIFDGKQINLSGIVREQILLSLPMDCVCKEECKGLCAVCGQDLNAGECGCQRKVIDPRWAVLKDLKI